MRPFGIIRITLCSILLRLQTLPQVDSAACLCHAFAALERGKVNPNAEKMSTGTSNTRMQTARIELPVPYETGRTAFIRAGAPLRQPRFSPRLITRGFSPNRALP